MSKSPKKPLTEKDRALRKEQDRLRLAQLQKEESEEKERKYAFSSSTKRKI